MAAKNEKDQRAFLIKPQFHRQRDAGARCYGIFAPNARLREKVVRVFVSPHQSAAQPASPFGEANFEELYLARAASPK